MKHQIRAAIRSGANIARIVEVLARGVIEVAQTNETVGSDLLLTVLPKASGSKAGSGISLSDEISSEQPTCLFAGGAGNARSVRAPHYVGGGLSVADVEVHDRALSPKEVRERFLKGKAEMDRWKD
ncbi:MAG: hypothetical protein AVDCRST_MAG53-1735 [uncultured Solirubrobacteraceae bacterium]|uniref:Uncharacterized protein n=1 Tax=uncultured Solirubrobacteraceae bacterium TaxID=1162706 RepID=A0A6J4SCR1_9ACTN|nr:MAG: hypothetical protein AVDCRST_MAG53-1735 [uncultured Solirubrobacteraceae bacterium]